MKILSVKKIFSLHLIVSLCLFFSDVVLAESYNAPEIKYLTTVNEFEGEKIGNPACVLMDSYDDLYILGGKTKTVYVFSNLSLPNARISQGQGLISPSFIAVSKEGELYAVESSAGGSPYYISVFTIGRRKIKTIEFKGFKGAETFVPNSIAIDSHKKIYLAGYTQPGVVVLDEKGNFFRMVTPEDTFGDKKPEPVVIRDLALDKKDNLYLLSEVMGRVYVYNQKFEFLFHFGKKGGVTGTLSRPRGIALDEKGRVYVTDYLRHCISIYDHDGSYLSEFGGKGLDHGYFNYPWDIAISQNNVLSVADFFSKRVELFKIID